MPIRVSYKGADGTMRSAVADNAFEASRRIEKLVGGGSGLGGASGFGQNTDGVKLSASGSIKSTVRGIELDGDSRMGGGTDNLVYARHGGRRGWFRQDELDPAANGRVIGDPFSNSIEEQTDNRSINDHTPFTCPSVSRIVIEKKRIEPTEEGGAARDTALMWAFVRDHVKTAGGRDVAVSEERRIFVGEVGGGSGGSADIGESFTKVGGVRFRDYEFQVRIDKVEVVDGVFVTTEGQWVKMEGGDTVAHSTTEY